MLISISILHTKQQQQLQLLLLLLLLQLAQLLLLLLQEEEAKSMCLCCVFACRRSGATSSQVKICLYIVLLVYPLRCTGSFLWWGRIR